MITDPDFNAWYTNFKDSRGNLYSEEMADKCVRFYGQTFPSRTGAPANISLNGNYYLIQQIWVNIGSGYCSMTTARP